MIDLHFAPTANGQKITIALEEVGLEYQLISYDIFEGHQHTAEFGKINPNHKLPAIVDHDPPFGGEPHAVFESVAILQYIADKTGQLLPSDPRRRSVAIQWLTWQAANLGPMGGQASHFVRYAPQRIEYAIDRYTREMERLLRILERRLGDAEYLAGDEYSIADIAVWPGRASGLLQGVDQNKYPNTYRWVMQIAERPAVVRGRSGERGAPDKYRRMRAVLTPEEWSNMFGDRFQNAVNL